MVTGATPYDVELQREKFFECETAPGCLCLLEGCGKMQLAQRLIPRSGGLQVADGRQCRRIGLLQEPVDNLAQTALRQPGNISVNGHDPIEVNGCRGVFFAQNFKLRVLNDQAPVAILHLAIKNHFVTGG